MNLFDFEERIFLKDNVEIYLSTASHGEAIMAKFVLGIWMQENKFNFDFIEAASVLDQGQMKVVTD
jgi:hypothetical protein